MPSNKKRVRVKWRDPGSIRSHWGPFAFDTTTGISRHSYPEFWPQVRAARHDPHLRTMFEIVEEPEPVVAERKPQFAPGEAPWDKPIDVLKARAANRSDGAHTFAQRDMLRTADQLAADEHAAALGTAEAPKLALVEQAFESGAPFAPATVFDDDKPQPPPPPKVRDVPPAPPADGDATTSWAEKMRAAKAAKASKAAKQRP